MGILRLYLALVVFEYHFDTGLTPVLPHSFAAVCIFFIISGFYMSLVLDGTYEQGVGGVLRFWTARGVRLYPAYLAVLGGMIAASAADWISADLWPPTPAGWLDQVAIFPAVLHAQLELRPSHIVLFNGPMWTVGLEMMFYALAPWLVRNRLPVLLASFGAAVGVLATPFVLGLDQRAWQYEFFPSTLAFFLAGALSYRIYRRIAPARLPASVGYACVTLIIIYGSLVHDRTCTSFVNDRLSILLYVIAALAIPVIFAATRDLRLDRHLGSVSYPFYVVHTAVIEIVTGPVSSIPQPWAPSCALVISLVLAVAIVLAIEGPIARLAQRGLGLRRPMLSPLPAE